MGSELIKSSVGGGGVELRPLISRELRLPRISLPPMDMLDRGVKNLPNLLGVTDGFRLSFCLLGRLGGDIGRGV